MSSAQAPKKVWLLFAGGGFSWETLSLAKQLEGECELTYLVPRGKVIAPAPGAGTIVTIPDVSPRGIRSILGLPAGILRMLIVLLRECRRSRPSIAICVGSALSIPIAFVCRIRGVPCVFIETITRPSGISKTGRVLRALRLPSRFFVQWPELENRPCGLEYKGTVL